MKSSDCDNDVNFAEAIQELKRNNTNYKKGGSNTAQRSFISNLENKKDVKNLTVNSKEIRDKNTNNNGIRKDSTRNTNYGSKINNWDETIKGNSNTKNGVDGIKLNKPKRTIKENISTKNGNDGMESKDSKQTINKKLDRKNTVYGMPEAKKKYTMYTDNTKVNSATELTPENTDYSHLSDSTMDSETIEGNNGTFLDAYNRKIKTNPETNLKGQSKYGAPMRVRGLYSKYYNTRNELTLTMNDIPSDLKNTNKTYKLNKEDLQYIRYMGRRND